MANDIVDEPLENPQDAQSQQLSEETFTTEEKEVITPNQPNENMDVHHHAHHAGKKIGNLISGNLSCYFLQCFVVL